MSTARQRDLRLDFFRGLALVFIFIDHIPGNTLAYVTLGSWNFCDAAEMFVFISGYTAALVFGSMMGTLGPGLTALRILNRCWVLYVAHIFLFVAFTAQVSYTAERFANPMFVEEMSVDKFLQAPHMAVLHALLLNFQPAFMDILPLYIVLMLGLAAFLPLIARAPWAALGLSFVLYVLAQRRGFNLPTYPEGRWFFSPAAWQFAFVAGACFGCPRQKPWAEFLDRRFFYWLAMAIVALAAAGRLFLTLQYALDIDWPRVSRVLWWGLNKTTMGPYRVVNFFALAYLAATAVKPGAAWLRRTWVVPVISMGQNSLYVFCLGIFLSYLGHLFLVEFQSGPGAHLGVSAAGVAIMAAAALGMDWVQRAESRRRSAAAVRSS